MIDCDAPMSWVRDRLPIVTGKFQIVDRRNPEALIPGSADLYTELAAQRSAASFTIHSVAILFVPDVMLIPSTEPLPPTPSETMP